MVQIVKGGNILYRYCVSRYIHDEGGDKISLIAKDIEFRFKNSSNGIRVFVLLKNRVAWLALWEEAE